MHDPNPIDIAAKASGEPIFREVGVGPWAQTHPGEERPDDPQSLNYDSRFDSGLLDEGDRRNVLDRYRYWSVQAIKEDLDSRGRHEFEVAVENWTHDFNIGSMVRTANAFQARRVHIVGPHKWNRKGALMTELYQHVENHPSIAELVECWKYRISGEIAAMQSQADAIRFLMRENARKLKDSEWTDALETGICAARVPSLRCSDDVSGASVASGTGGVSAGGSVFDGAADVPCADVADAECYRSGVTPNDVNANGVDGQEIAAQLAQLAQLVEVESKIAELQSARVIALDIIPGAVPMETYRFPKRCLMLFGAEGPGLSEKALELADDVVYISQFGSVRSINAGAAAAVSMHAWIVQHAAPQA